MGIFKKLLSVCAVFIFMALSVTVVLAGELGEDKMGRGVSLREIAESVRDKQKNGVSLDAFKDKKYDGCYGNQLTPDSRIIYDAIVECVEKSKDGVSDLGLEKRTMNFEDGPVDLDIIYLPEKSFDDVEITINPEGLDFVYYAWMAFDYDYPEVFWLDWGKFMVMPGMTGDGRVWVNLYLNEEYDNYYCDGYTSKKEVERDEKVLKTVLTGVHEKVKNMDTYNKLDYFNEYLVRKNEYNRILLEIIAGDLDKLLDGRIWKSVGALIYGNTDWKNPLNPVCEGYSRAFKVLCDYESIECVLVSGDYGGDHMWNYVKIPDKDNNKKDDDGKKGKWYAVDVTSNDPVFNVEPSEEDIIAYMRNYFLIGYKSLTEGVGDDNNIFHVPETEGIFFECIKNLSYPVLESDDYIYDPAPERPDNPDNPTKPIIIGDVDDDGEITMNDAKRLLEIVLSEEVTDRIKAVGNIDKSNNNITAADVSALVQMVLQSEDALSVTE